MRPLDHRVNDADVLPVIEEAMRATGWNFADLTHIACVIGPGGFMSLRVGVALANTLMHQLKIPGAGIHLSDLYAARLSLPGEACSADRGGGGGERQTLWLHSTKKTELFIRGFGELSKQWPEPVLMSVDALAACRKQHAGSRWIGELIPEHAALLSAMGIEPASLRSLPEVLPDFLAGLTYDSRLLEPWYGREG